MGGGIWFSFTVLIPLFPKLVSGCNHKYGGLCFKINMQLLGHTDLTSRSRHLGLHVPSISLERLNRSYTDVKMSRPSRVEHFALPVSFRAGASRDPNTEIPTKSPRLQSNLFDRTSTS
ncbi:hypothetical protein RIF29_29623 [Crotalaria pallida]|uniref:Secreted protein n=1 Tax=Crotalaria pallida TaxID=3830 RepID=A0AAN9EK31_CROPI